MGRVEPASFPESDPCPQAHRCRQLQVICPEVRDPARVSVAEAKPEGPSRGTVVFLSGGGGRSWWGDEGSTTEFLMRLRSDGFGLIQVRWKDEWLQAAPGERAGPQRLGCRPATLLRWIQDEFHPPLEPAAPTACGFCVTGASGGASQLTYALAFYGLDQIVDAAIPSGGPPHAALDRACRRDPADRAYWYDGPAPRIIDSSWGFPAGSGPCDSHDESWTEAWQRSSVDLGGADYDYPDTRVHVLIGQLDRILPHAEDYVARLRAEGSGPVELEIVSGMGHSIASSPEGLAALRRILLA
jgi:hypothetical protein